MGATAAGRPLVSVVIPTYGRPDYLADAIRSVSDQTYEPVELVVVDDHSPTPVEQQVDASVGEGLADVQFVRHSENRGANAARGTGIEAASGEFVAFLDDDDFWDSTVLEREVAAFERGGDEVGVVMVGSRIVDADGRQIGSSTPDARGEVTEGILRGHVKAAPFSQFVVRAAVIREAGPPDPEIPSWQDKEWHIRLSQYCRYESVPALLAARRHASHSQITDDFERKRDVSYPLLVEKHRETAATFGPSCERRFVATLNRTLGFSALRNRRYVDAIRHLVQALRYDPTLYDAYLYLLLALGGPVTYLPAMRAKRWVADVLGGRDTLRSTNVET